MGPARICPGDADGGGAGLAAGFQEARLLGAGDDLAEKLGLNVQTVNNYMSTKPMSAKTVGRIAAALEYPLELLLRGERYYGPAAYEALEERIRKLEEIVFQKQGQE